MSSLLKVLKYEFVNIRRNRWVFIYMGLMALISFAFIRIAGDFSKALLSLSEVLSVLVPLVSILFATVYWYYSERFTELMLTQPLPRPALFFGRWLAISTALGISLTLGVALPYLISGGLERGLILTLAVGFFLTFVFVTLGLLISVTVIDRMKGIGFALGIWVYFAIVHDGGLLLFLLAFRDYPLDVAAGLGGAVNPVGLSRVVSIMFFDASFLLGHSGALVRKVLGTGLGYFLALVIGTGWLVFPVGWAALKFQKRDF